MVDLTGETSSDLSARGKLKHRCDCKRYHGCGLYLRRSVVRAFSHLESVRRFIAPLKELRNNVIFHALTTHIRTSTQFITESMNSESLLYPSIPGPFLAVRKAWDC